MIIQNLCIMIVIIQNDNTKLRDMSDMKYAFF
jgi:hypothetical protein